MTISKIMEKMIEFSKGNRHDINHFMKVHSFAKLIGECEKLDEEQQQTLEIAAIIHDIACPLCRAKYGNSNGKKQEEEGMPLAAEFLQDMNIPDEIVKRVIFLVGHHHTLTNVVGMDYQILLEADYLVNADESRYSSENIAHALQHIFKTKSGIRLLKTLYF